MARDANEKRSSLVRNLIVVLFVAGAAVFVFVQFQKRQRIVRENEAVELRNQGRTGQAVPIYLALHETANATERARLGEEIAACYLELAEEPQLSFDEQMVLYRKAYSFDPASITNPKIREVIEQDP